jgi:hypothetical protein
MSWGEPTYTQMEHLVKWVEAKAYPRKFDPSFIESMEDVRGRGWTLAQEIAIDNIYRKFRVAQWVRDLKE